MYMRLVATSVTMSERSTGEPVVIICDISVKVIPGVKLLSSFLAKPLACELNEICGKTRSKYV